MLTSLYYILAILLANIFATQIINFGGITFSIGTLFFGLVFTLRDYLHIQLGRHKTYYVIFLAVGINALFSLVGTFSLRVLLASALAMLISEVIDTEIFHKLKEKSFVLRVITSNSVSIITDTVLFLIIAFYGVFPNELLLSLLIGNIVIKYITSLVLIVRKQWYVRSYSYR